MKARDIMTRDPEVLTRDDTLTRAAQLMRERDVGIIPVVADRDSMRLEGVVTDRDIAIRHVAEGHTGDGCRVEEAMTRDDIATARPEDDSHQVMELMRSRQVRRVPVVEDGERLIGIIAQADLAVRERDDREVERTVEAISEPARPQR